MTRRLVLGGLLGTGAQLASLGLLLTSGWLVVRAAEQPPVLYLIVAITSVRMFGVARAALRYGERLLTHDAALARTIDARVAAYTDLERVAPGGLAGRRHGDVVRTVVADVESLQDALLRIRLPWIATLVASAVIVLVVGLILPPAGLVLAAYVGVVLLLLRVIVPRLVRAAARSRSCVGGRLAAGATEIVRCAPDLLAYGDARGRDQRVHADVDRVGRADRRHAWAGGLGTAIVLAACAVTVWLLVGLVADAGLAPTIAAVVILAPIGLADVLDTVAEAERLRPRTQEARARLSALAALESPVGEPTTPREPDGFALELEDVAIGWDHDLVRHLDVTVPQGSTLVVTGPSGSGKSTLATTLVRMLEPRAGTIRLGGVDVREIAGEQVRRVVGRLGQDETILDTTMRENLRVGDPAADEGHLRDALRRAGLLDFVDGLPAGLDTPVGEGGRELSGGERQRLALARLLVAGHRVLVLDEPTEHLDGPTASALMDDVMDLAPEHTLVVVTHSPDVVARFPRRLDLGRTAVPTAA